MLFAASDKDRITELESENTNLKALVEILQRQLREHGVQPQTVRAAESALISETGDCSFVSDLGNCHKAPSLEDTARAIIRRAQAYFDTNKRKSGTQKNTSNKKRKADPSNCKRGGSSSWSLWG